MQEDLSRNSDIRKAHLFDLLKHSNKILADKFLQVSLRPATGAKQFGQQVGVTGHVLQPEGCAGNTSAVSDILQRAVTNTYEITEECRRYMLRSRMISIHVASLRCLNQGSLA